MNEDIDNLQAQIKSLEKRIDALESPITDYPEDSYQALKIFCERYYVPIRTSHALTRHWHSNSEKYGDMTPIEYLFRVATRLIKVYGIGDAGHTALSKAILKSGIVLNASNTQDR